VLCDFSKQASACYVVSPDGQNYKFHSKGVVAFDYNKVCGGCDVGRPTPPASQLYCSPENDFDCSKADSTVQGQCDPKNGGLHAGFKYMMDCKSAMDTLVDFVNGIKKLINPGNLLKILLYFGIAIASMMVLYVIYRVIMISLDKKQQKS
jgi:hypothetical protein